MLQRLDGQPAQPLHPDTTVCHTADGVAVDPTEAAANSLLYAVLRVIVDAQSVVIDQGHARCYTRGARKAAKHGHTRCIWPGCHTPVSRCETDHLTPHSRHGPTNPHNGAPLCGRHNRWKQRGFTITRQPNGTLHIHRPDGTQLE